MYVGRDYPPHLASETCLCSGGDNKKLKNTDYVVICVKSDTNVLLS